MKKIISILLALLICLIPFNAYATDFGDYCSDSVVYPTDDIPSFSSLISNSELPNALIYNELN